MVDHVQILENDWQSERASLLRAVNNALRLPYVVKPANIGPSAGETKVKGEGDLAAGIEPALSFDEKVLIERGIEAREIEVAVLGNETVEASVPGEVVAGHEFYDYEDKYVDDKTQLLIPAKLPKERVDELRRLAVAAFKAVGASGFARVDFFLERGTSRLFVNEINTIPGFTTVSKNPKLWEATELKYSRLIERIIELGLARSQARAKRRAPPVEWFEQGEAGTGLFDVIFKMLSARERGFLSLPLRPPLDRRRPVH